MSNVTFDFNLDPVVSAASQRTSTVTTESSAEIGAKFEAAQSSVSSNGLMSVGTPTCDSGCYIVTGEGPGVTTLSIGEEDSGGSDFFALPMVDGVEFLEPPVTSFASAGDFDFFLEPPVTSFASASDNDITTLAIGEEDGGSIGPVAEIGNAYSSAAPVANESTEIGQQFSFAPIETMPFSEPMIAQTFETVSVQSGLPPIETTPIIGSASFAEPELKPMTSMQPIEMASVQSGLPPIETTPIIGSASFAEPRMKPTVSAQPVETASVQLDLPPLEATPILGSASFAEPRMKPTVSAQPIETASTQSGSNPIETTPIVGSDSFIEPRVKPASIASSGSPLPDLKPSVIPASIGVAAADVAVIPTSADEDVVSVGDYDSYLASLSGSENNADAAVTGGEAVEPTVVQAAVTYEPPPAAPELSLQSMIAVTPEPAVVVQETATTQVAALDITQPITDSVATIPQMTDSQSPRVKPATFTSPGPATLPPIETVPIQANAIGDVSVQQGVPLGSNAAFATIDGPVPSGKPAGLSGDSPRLSADDFRITTLALGEEDAGGG